MINPDRWLQRCAEDYQSGDDEDRWDEEHECIMRDLRMGGVDPKNCDLHDKIYPLQKELMQALAKDDNPTILSILYSAFDIEVKEMVDRAVDNY